ncbi:U32 family peptidase [Candidatus Bathyarchaeota archaeon]|nr:U32 family peptidase [Candidatus Bathyarchaeota archaeon]
MFLFCGQYALTSTDQKTFFSGLPSYLSGCVPFPWLASFFPIWENLFWIAFPVPVGMEKVELLAPCRNWQSLKAAEKYADAVYFGTHVLNLRQQADNFDIQELQEVTNYCHDRDLEVYLTVNAIIYDNEIQVLRETLEAASDAGIDAAILHDLAAIQVAREIGIPFHISTQANVSNTLSAQFYQDLGATRVILARELSLEMIKAVAGGLSTTGVEIFVHGAMCTSISGRCYLSLDCMDSDTFSGNRGRCVQPCRRRWRVIDEENNEFLYNGKMFLNTKDLCMIEYIPELFMTGARSFKIEGRMRDPHYVEVVTRCYREAMDSYQEGTYTKDKIANWLDQLSKVFNRGFTTGFFFQRPTEKDVEHDIRGNVSKFRMIEVGYVNDFFSKKKVVKIILTNGSLKLGNEIFFKGRGSTTYFHQEITSMRIHGKDVTETPVATSKNHVLVSIKVKERVKENDRVFIFTNETYENFKAGKDRTKRYNLY